MNAKICKLIRRQVRHTPTEKANGLELRPTKKVVGFNLPGTPEERADLMKRFRLGTVTDEEIQKITPRYAMQASNIAGSPRAIYRAVKKGIRHARTFG